MNCFPSSSYPTLHRIRVRRRRRRKKMTQDEEMKDRPTPSQSIPIPIPSTLQRINSIFIQIKTSFSHKFLTFFFFFFTENSFLLSDLKEIASIIETGSNLKEVRKISRAVRLTMAFRSKLTAPLLSSFLHHVLPPHSTLSSYLPNSKVIPFLSL